jgi:hypothetical protein
MGIRIRVNFPRAVLRTIEVMAWDWAICRNLRSRSARLPQSIKLGSRLIKSTIQEQGIAPTTVELGKEALPTLSR